MMTFRGILLLLLLPPVLCLLHGTEGRDVRFHPAVRRAANVLQHPTRQEEMLSRLEALRDADDDDSEDEDEDEDEEAEDLIHDVEGHETDDTLIVAYPNDADVQSANAEPSHRRKTLELSIICIASCKRKLSLYGDPADIIYRTIQEMDFRLKVVEISSVIVSMEIWDEDLIDFSSGTLAPVREYRADVINSRVRSDVTILFSGQGIPTKSGKSVGGKSGIGKACMHNDSVVVAKHGGKNVFFAGMTLTHEMSHNLGMTHASDACCPERNCMMGKGGGRGDYYTYSGCNMRKHAAWLERDGDCLYDMPEAAFIPEGVDSCGNGFREPWEECDCGMGCLHGCCDTCIDCMIVEPVVEIESVGELRRRADVE